MFFFLNFLGKSLTTHENDYDYEQKISVSVLSCMGENHHRLGSKLL